MVRVSAGPLALADLPPDVAAVVEHFRTCEFSTLARDGTPITWPTLPFWEAESGRFLITTSIGLAQKALNARRNRRVSLFFSNPTASGLEQPPALLVQGDAEAPDRVEASVRGSEALLRKVLQRQPAGRAYSSNFVHRWLFDWYYMRLRIWVRPRRLYWWVEGGLPFGAGAPGAGRCGLSCCACLQSSTAQC